MQCALRQDSLSDHFGAIDVIVPFKNERSNRKANSHTTKTTWLLFLEVNEDSSQQRMGRGIRIIWLTYTLHSDASTKLSNEEE